MFKPIFIQRSDNKWSSKPRTQTGYKKKLIRDKKSICMLCNNQVVPSFTILDHIVPVCLGGKLDDELNIQLLCKKCEIQKTILDKKIIVSAKNLGLLSSEGGMSWSLWITPEELEEFYYYCLKIKRKAELNRKE
jgi:hypothetical protein